MNQFDLHINCTFCDNEVEQKVDIPEGWSSHYRSFDEENGLCPDHSKIAEWADAQCPGCVSSWGDCKLFSLFQRPYERDLTEDEFKKIRSGICPVRTNGTFSVSRSPSEVKIEDVHLDEQATTESGVLLEQAIKDYLKRWPKHST